jgi:hypothetical protein
MVTVAAKFPALSAVTVPSEVGPEQIVTRSVAPGAKPPPEIVV